MMVSGNKDGIVRFWHRSFRNLLPEFADKKKSSTTCPWRTECPLPRDIWLLLSCSSRTPQPVEIHPIAILDMDRNTQCGTLSNSLVSDLEFRMGESARNAWLPQSSGPRYNHISLLMMSFDTGTQLLDVTFPRHPRTSSPCFCSYRR